MADNMTTTSVYGTTAAMNGTGAGDNTTMPTMGEFPEIPPFYPDYPDITYDYAEPNQVYGVNGVNGVNGFPDDIISALTSLSPGGEDYDLDLFQEEWKQYLEQNHFSQMLLDETIFSIIFGSTWCLFGAIGFFSNIFIFVMMMTKEEREVSQGVYLASLACVDVVLSFTHVFRGAILLSVRVKGVESLNATLTTPLGICTVEALENPLITAHAWIMVALLVDSIVSVCLPVRRQLVCTVRKAVGAVIGTFVLALAVDAYSMKHLIETAGRKLADFQGLDYAYRNIKYAFIQHCAHASRSAAGSRAAMVDFAFTYAIPLIFVLLATVGLTVELKKRIDKTRTVDTYDEANVVLAKICRINRLTITMVCLFAHFLILHAPKGIWVLLFGNIGPPEVESMRGGGGGGGGGAYLFSARMERAVVTEAPRLLTPSVTEPAVNGFPHANGHGENGENGVRPHSDDGWDIGNVTVGNTSSLLTSSPATTDGPTTVVITTTVDMTTIMTTEPTTTTTTTTTTTIADDNSTGNATDEWPDDRMTLTTDGGTAAHQKTRSDQKTPRPATRASTKAVTARDDPWGVNSTRSVPIDPTKGLTAYRFCQTLLCLSHTMNLLILIISSMYYRRLFYLVICHRKVHFGADLSRGSSLSREALAARLGTPTARPGTRRIVGLKHISASTSFRGPQQGKVHFTFNGPPKNLNLNGPSPSQDPGGSKQNNGNMASPTEEILKEASMKLSCYADM